MRKLELYVTDSEVSVVRGVTVATFTVRGDGTVCVTVPPDAPDRVEWQTTTNLDRQPLEVEVVTYEQPEEGSMALPRAQRTKAATRTIKPVRRARAQVHYENNIESITSDESRKILTEIVRSLRRKPEQTRAEVSKESIRIAEKLGVGKMQVAGVRANLTRGTYGNPKKIIEG